METMKRVAIRSALLLFAAAPALAVDGVREINQVCAETTGCFTGDSAGFPVTVTAPGSYRLTGNLQIPDANTHGIQVSTSDVSIDLNGYRVGGPVGCSLISPVVCSSSGSGRGITVDVDSNLRLAVRNGTVAGAGNAGVFVGQFGVVENVRAASNAGDGIRTGGQSRVERCNASANGGRGIAVLSNSIVESSQVFATGAGMAGIEASLGGTVRGNVVVGAGDDGIHTFGREMVLDNGIRGCGGDGIQVETEGRVSGNNSSGNTGFGLRFVGLGSSYSGNLISSNTAGTVTGPANVNTGGNVCNSVLCP
jgi:hypothetical protein